MAGGKLYMAQRCAFHEQPVFDVV